LRRNADTALQEMAAAARAMRALAELLERYPQSILRGRPLSP
jgi:paraquat-inducible protein B